MGGPALIADPDDALRGEWGVNNQNYDMILEYAFLGDWKLVYSHTESQKAGILGILDTEENFQN